MDETEVDDGQDYREPRGVAVPQVQAAPSVPVAPPPSSPIVPPRFMQYDPQVAEDDRFRFMINRGLPIEQAEQAVAAAMKYQAIRGYRRDLDNGVPAATAMARWAPAMFSGPKEANLGQAASLVRATAPQQPKFMDVGGVGYQFESGKATPLTPPKAVKPKTIPLVLPADPENPMAGGHVTIQLPEDDPLVRKALERARQGPVPPTPEPPGVLSKIGDRVKNFFGGGAAPNVAPPQSANTPVSAPAATIAQPIPARAAKPTTPEEKVAAARALRAEHPDWTKKQILDAVNQMR